MTGQHRQPNLLHCVFWKFSPHHYLLDNVRSSHSSCSKDRALKMLGAGFHCFKRFVVRGTNSMRAFYSQAPCSQLITSGGCLHYKMSWGNKVLKLRPRVYCLNTSVHFCCSLITDMLIASGDLLAPHFLTK